MGPLKWWQQAVFYQVYPRSFADGNGDGIGDLAGLIGKLDTLRDLGIGAIWLSPHYPSPLYDCGYDVADYTGVASEYGTLEDFRWFLAGAHERGIRVVLDMVLNHTSDQHPWFIESRSSRQSPKRDWYLWKAGRNGGPPNNWYSTFGGPAWELDALTGDYYYHYFFKQQPDLNWRNPQVKKAMFDAMRFWLDLGVDGFRLDAIGTIFEDPDLPDHESTLTQADLYQMYSDTSFAWENLRLTEEYRKMYRYQVDQPGIHALMRELRQVVDEYEDRVLIGETEDVAYYGRGDDELHMIFNFPLMRTAQLTPELIRGNQKERLAALPSGAWPANTLGNHDASRVISRFGDGEHNGEIARLCLALMLTLRGTPFLYNGEEIGMSDLLLEDLSQFRDMLGVWAYHMERDELGNTHERALANAARYGRDKCRTPMQWSHRPNGGFCPARVKPWLAVNPNWAEGLNVADQEKDEKSLLQYYRQLIHLRAQMPALLEGGYQSLNDTDEDVLSFLRTKPGGQICLVVMNFSQEGLLIQFDKLRHKRAKLLFSSRLAAQGDLDLGSVELAPFEFILAELVRG